MSGYSGGGIIPPAGDIGGTILAPRITDIGGKAITLLGGATGDVLTQQADGSFEPKPGGGGGGGVSLAYLAVSTGPDSMGDNTTNDGGAIMGPSLLDVFPNQNMTPMFLPAPASLFGVIPFGFGWVVSTGGGGVSVVVLPELQAPTFTGGPINVKLVMAAVSVDNTNQGQWQTTFPGINLTSGETVQLSAADFSESFNNAGDLSLVDGSGDSGNGIVAASNKTYLGAVWGEIAYGAVTAWT